MLDDGLWHQISAGNSPPNYYGWTLTVSLPFPADYLEFEIQIHEKPHWIRAGYFKQLWLPGEGSVIYSRRLNQESRIFKIEPINECVLTFTALSYVANFSYQIVARHYEP